MTTQPALFDLSAPPDVRPHRPGDEPRRLTCPACGHTAESWTMSNMRTYHGWAEAGEVCMSMNLRRNHVYAALRDGREETNRRHRRRTTPSSFEMTMAAAVESWGERAREFIPAEHWPATA